MLIEFVGVPGAGKTYSADRLREWLASSQIDFVDLDAFMRKRASRKDESVPRLESGRLDLGNRENDVFLRSFRAFMMAEPRYVLAYLEAIFSVLRDRRTQNTVLASFCHCCATRGYYLKREARLQSSVAIQEEGLTQRLFTLVGYGTDVPVENGLLQKLAELMPKPDVVIWAQCPPSLAYQRLQARGEKIPDRLVGRQEEDVECMLAHGTAQIAEGVKILEARGSRVVALDARKKLPGFDALRDLLRQEAND